MTTTERTAAKPFVERNDEALNERRALHTRLGLFHLCEDARCGHARACRGAIEACTRIRGVHVPQAVHDFLDAEFELGRLAYDDAAPDDDEREQVEAMRVALACWCAALEAASILRRQKRR